MKTIKFDKYTVDCYEGKDLVDPKFVGSVADARMMWQHRIYDYCQKNGDKGSCVIGAGIEIDIIKPRCKYPERKTIIRVCELTGAQGSLTWEESVQDVLSFLSSNGITAYYNPGRMH